MENVRKPLGRAEGLREEMVLLETRTIILFANKHWVVMTAHLGCGMVKCKVKPVCPVVWIWQSSTAGCRLGAGGNLGLFRQVWWREREARWLKDKLWSLTWRINSKKGKLSSNACWLRHLLAVWSWPRFLNLWLSSHILKMERIAERIMSSVNMRIKRNNCIYSSLPQCLAYDKYSRNFSLFFKVLWKFPNY